LCSGEVLAWGINGAGELGDGTFQDRQAPVKVQQLGGRVIKLFVSSVSGTTDLFLACVAL
jgi:alpha-tubulin suppressor-like RCC1 family protein